MVFINVLSFVFFIRRPVVLVIDTYFSEVYGANFERIRRLEASFKILRSIKLVRIIEESNTLSISESIMKASANPYAVFFQHSYADAAEYYSKNIVKEQGLDIKTFLFLERNNASPDEKPYYYVRNDTDIDFHRAGSFAAALVVPQFNNEEEQQDKTILFITNFNINPEEKRSFVDGVQEGLFKGKTDFISGYENRSWDKIAAVVIYGTAQAFLQSQTDIPVVLFSWYNNIYYMPSCVKILIDDSPYFSIPESLRLERNVVPGARGFSIPSNFTVLEDRIENKSLVAHLRRLNSVFYNHLSGRIQTGKPKK